jgi:hypothetical protein
LPGDTVVFVTGQVQRDLMGTAWDERFQRIDVEPSTPRLADIEIYRLGKRGPDSNC